MLRKRKIKYISILVIISLIITLFTPCDFISYAESMDYVQEAFENITNCREEIDEARYDSCDTKSTNDWDTATKEDHLPWNFFHICVQLKICELDKKIKKEKRIFYNDGLYGSADLYYENTENNLLSVWEVKPISYKSGDKRIKANEQLLKYVREYNSCSDNNSGVITATLGNDKIQNGSMEVKLLIPRIDGIEEVVYVIKWYNEGDGLILYTFTRYSNGKRKQEEPQHEELPAAVVPKNEFELDYIDLVTIGTGDETTGDETTGETADLVDTKDGKNYKPSQLAKLLLAIAGGAAISVGVGVAIEKLDSVSQTTLALASRYIQSYFAAFMNNGLGTGVPNTVALQNLNSAADDLMNWMFALYGEDFETSLMMAINDGNTEKIDELIEKLQNMDEKYEDAASVAPPRDPLIIDLGSDGIELTTLSDGVNFDLDRNGFAEKTAWIGTEDGFLAMDKNENGIIDNGGELFGDRFIMENGRVSSSGFEALISLDENEDGIIDSEDDAFSELFIWIDGNHNGRTENSELVSLEDMDIVSIDTDFVIENNVDMGTGTMCAEYSKVLFKDGERKIGEFWFPVNPSDTTQGGNKTAGNVPDIIEAIKEDSSGYLDQLCVSFAKEKDIPQKHRYLKEILYYVTGVGDIEPDDRGGNIDARDLHVIEQFMGREFNGVDGSNPNAPAAEILKDIYNEIENTYYNILNMETDFGGLTCIVAEYPDEDNNRQIMIETYDDIIERAKKNEIDKDSVMLVYDIAMYLRNFDSINKTNYFAEFAEKYCSKSEEYAYVINLAGAGNTYLGTESGDSFYGTNYNDFIFGNQGNDVLNGGNGIDYIYGGKGNDALDGGAGTDYYYFDEGHGEDIILDCQENSNIIFSDKMDYDCYSYNIGDGYEMIIQNDLTGDRVVLGRFMDNPLSYNIKFGDVTRIIGGGTEKNLIEGSTGDDILNSKNGLNLFKGDSGNDTINGGEYMDIAYGGDGNDVIYGANGFNILFGGNGDDIIYDGDHSGNLNGEGGNDTLLAGGGDDVLDGGTGDDMLQGDHGNDVYIYKSGYNYDVITDSEGDNIVRIYGYVPSDMAYNTNDRKDLIINFNESEDALAITGFFEDGANKSFVFKFQDGTIIREEDIVIEAEESDSSIIEGTEGDDWLNILDANGGIAYGYGGNDGINGGNGDDYLDGGAGNDALYGGNGNDTYVYGLNGGNDTICDWNGDSYVILSDFDIEDVEISYSNNQDLVFRSIETGETLVISGFRWNQNNWEFKFKNDCIVKINRDNLEVEVISVQENICELENVVE